MKVVVVTPFPVLSPRGNSVSARRIGAILESLPDVEAEVVEAGAGVGADVLVALHARRSAAAVRAFRGGEPSGKVALILTGSDLYHDLGAGDPEVPEMLAGADLLVVAQEASVADVPEPFREKVVVVPKSLYGVTLPPASRSGGGEGFGAVLCAHLRPLKDPLRSAAAARLLPRERRLRIDHYGEAKDPVQRAAAERESRENPRYTWCGAVPRDEAVAATAACDLVLNTSLAEGGANALCEALQLGKAIVASAIPGNIGMVGDGHPGLFAAGDTAALADLLDRAEAEPGFLSRLEACSRERAPLFSVAAERRGWEEVLRRLGA